MSNHNGYANVFLFRIAFHLNGIINEKAIVKSFHALVDRHDSLRTTFLVKSGIPYQIIHPKSSYGFDVSLIDATDLSNEDIRKKAYEIAQTPFDLRTGPLLKVSLLKRDKENYFLFFCSHHIVNDGHSFNILMREFSEFYTLYCRDAESELNFPPPRIQYADFSVWQRAWLEGNVRQNQLTYWTKQLSNLSPLDFPSFYDERLSSHSL